MSQEIILYDLPDRHNPPKSWSLNPWKARAALNFKGLSYKTQWVEYPDIEPLFKSFGIPPNDPNINPNYPYSIPAAHFPDGKYIMDSLAIAKQLERIQPSPSLQLDNGYVDKTQKAVLAVLGALAPVAMPRVPELLLNPPSANYFNRTREKRFGMPLPELAKSEKAQNAWNEAEEPIRALVGLLKENGGSYVAGKEASFADLILAGLWRFLQVLDKEGDLWGRVKGVDAVVGEHYEVCKGWLERDDR
ncbi:hypothetical protein EJ03DRAFT_375235 [Teratosphaeria nubilosa]|uniref:Uncharacterized protein n=1 Tax=Teratosphaeria nubilosa TaxID=161662 RepID=A0A6G1L7E3_9PEZI|nr:hypothetical protein EJ03DRAFT_375235 [Teratosphaeria nubilosa]